MLAWLSPPQVAKERGVKPAKVLAWIATGELAAVNHAESRMGRPRWRISRAALDAFDQVRSNRRLVPVPAPREPAVPTPPRASRVRQPKGGVIEFF